MPLENQLRAFHSNVELWEELAGAAGQLRSGLRSMVDSGASNTSWILCRGFLQNTLFEAAVHGYCKKYGWTGAFVEPARLVRHAQALGETARVAWAARAAASRRSGLDESILETAKAAAALLPCPRADFDTQVEAHSDPVWHVCSLYDELEQSGIGTAAARYWTLYWLGEERQMEDRAVSVPVVAVNSLLAGLSSLAGHFHKDAAAIANLSLRKLVRGPAGAIEHPDNALLPLASDLAIGVNQAAAAAAPDLPVVWLLGVPFGPHCGDSLTAGAAVGFAKLAAGEDYTASTVILGRLQSDANGMRICSVESKTEADKLAAIAQAGRYTKVVLGDSGRVGQKPASPASSSLKLVFVRSLAEAVRNSGPSLPWAIKKDHKLLKRYTTFGASVSSDEYSETWHGEDDYRGAEYLIKVFPFGDTDKLVTRAVWDRQYRTMYRLSNSRGAEDTLLVMHDAGLDPHAGQDGGGAFVLVMHAPGYETLASSLAKEARSKHPDLDGKNLFFPQYRRRIWMGLRRIARGIQALHGQQVIHWNVCAENVFWHSTSGIDSWRLGGFEKNPRFSAFTQPPRLDNQWPIPPERARTPEHGLASADDWYGFGLLAARCFYPIEALGKEPPEERNRQLREQIRRQPQPLSESEADFVLRLIDLDPGIRPKAALDVLASLDKIMDGLSRQAAAVSKEEALVLVIDPSDEKAIPARALECGWRPDPANPSARFVWANPQHRKSLTEFLMGNFRRGQVHVRAHDGRYVLKGSRFNVLIDAQADHGRPKDWKAAFAYDVGDIKSEVPPCNLGDVEIQ